eukprot:1052457-Pleurochrysis_carterae.AAC.1
MRAPPPSPLARSLRPVTVSCARVRPQSAYACAAARAVSAACAHRAHLSSSARWRATIPDASVARSARLPHARVLLRL